MKGERDDEISKFSHRPETFYENVLFLWTTDPRTMIILHIWLWLPDYWRNDHENKIIASSKTDWVFLIPVSLPGLPFLLVPFLLSSNVCGLLLPLLLLLFSLLSVSLLLYGCYLLLYCFFTFFILFYHRYSSFSSCVQNYQCKKIKP